MLFSTVYEGWKNYSGFSARDSREVVLRTPKWEGLDCLLELVNSLVEERADIARTKKVSKEEEIDWLSRVKRFTWLPR